jgi:hypothetical protein
VPAPVPVAAPVPVTAPVPVAAPVPVPVPVSSTDSTSCAFCQGLGRGCLRYSTKITFSNGEVAICDDAVTVSEVLSPGTCLGDKAVLEQICCPCLSANSEATGVEDRAADISDTTDEMDRDNSQLYDPDDNRGTRPGGRVGNGQ